MILLLLLITTIKFDLIITAFTPVGLYKKTIRNFPRLRRTSLRHTSTMIPSSADFFNYLHYNYDEEDTTSKKARIPSLEDIEFEPVVNTVKEKIIFDVSINCEEFENYALNCTLDSAMIYNSSKKSPPMPAKMFYWCKAIRHLTNCAIDWNSECKDVTESHFNEESIKGHMHVVNSICDNEWFLSHYDDLPLCIDRVANIWEACYNEFAATVNHEKNLTQEWTHYKTHFQLCCARTRFRHCTLDALFLKSESKCSQDQALILQKFSVIVSQGDVFQDCDNNILYSNCPNGDPRPPTELLSQLMNAEAASKEFQKAGSSPRKMCSALAVWICILKMCL